MRTPDHCSQFDPRIKCRWRADAESRGDFFYHFGAGGWVWSAFTEKDAPRLMAWLSCPSCHEPLPTGDLLLNEEE